MRSEILVGISEVDSPKVEKTIDKLLDHLKPENYALVGGLAIEYYLEKHRIARPRRNLGDLDFILRSGDTLLPSVSRDFLIYHYHPEKDGQFYFVVVDKETQMKVDLFDWSVPPNQLVEVGYKDQTLPIISAEDQLVKTVWDMMKPAQGYVVDPKQFDEGSLLRKIVDIDLANQYWREKELGRFGADIDAAMRLAIKSREEHPELLIKNPYRKNQPYECEGCQSTTDFKVDPMEKVFRALGYVE